MNYALLNFLMAYIFLFFMEWYEYVTLEAIQQDCS